MDLALSVSVRDNLWPEIPAGVAREGLKWMTR